MSSEQPAYPPASGAGVLAAAAAMFEVSVAALKGPGRTGELVRARHAACLVLRLRPAPHSGCQRSYPEIGRLLGGRDHSTAVSAKKRAEQVAGRDPAYAAAIDTLLRVAVPAGEPPLVLPPVLSARELVRRQVDAALSDRSVRERNALADDDSDALKRAKGSIALAAALRNFHADRGVAG